METKKTLKGFFKTIKDEFDWFLSTLSVSERLRWEESRAFGDTLCLKIHAGEINTQEDLNTLVDEAANDNLDRSVIVGQLACRLTFGFLPG